MNPAPVLPLAALLTAATLAPAAAAQYGGPDFTLQNRFSLSGGEWERLGDLDLDGVEDFGGAGQGTDVVTIYSGATGAVLLSHSPAQHVAGLSDWDGDGHPDLAFGDENYGLNDGAVTVISYGTGAQLHFSQGWPGASYGNDIVEAPDMDGDGHPDLLIGSSSDDTYGVDAGGA